jgi:putative Ca2+/H+ antiporter (TMEM165/GDT1 family)
MLYLGHLVNTMTDTFADTHRATALMMAAIFVLAAGVFDLVDGAVSENPLLFIAGVLFSCFGVFLFDLRKQNLR